MSDRNDRPTPRSDEQFVEVVRAYQERRVRLFVAILADGDESIRALGQFVGTQSAGHMGEVASAAGQTLGAIVAQVCELLPAHAARTLMTAMQDANLLSRPTFESRGGTVERRDDVSDRQPEDEREI